MKFCPHCKKLLRPGTENMLDDSSTHYSTTDAAIIAQVSVQTILNWCDAGKILFYRVGRGPRKVEKLSFLEYLAKHGQDVSWHVEQAKLAMERANIARLAMEHRAQNPLRMA